MNGPGDARVDALKRDIVELVIDNWKKTGKVLLLSKLGKALTDKGYNLKADLAGERLEPFIERTLGDQVRLISSPDNAPVRGAVPSGERLLADLRQYFQIARVPANSSDAKKKPFDRRLWGAFAYPLPEGSVRTIAFEPQVNFQDVDADAAAKSGKLTVARELIYPIGTIDQSIRNATIQKKIHEWLRANNIPEEKALATKVVGPRNILSQFIEALDKEEQARIVVPLDIVAKLLKAETHEK